MKIYIANAISLSMLDREDQSGSPTGYVPRTGTPASRVGTARIPVPLDEDAKEWLRSMSALGAEIVSAVGHPDTAALFSSLLGIPVECNRISVRLGRDDILLIGQIMAADGGMVRLAPGTTELPLGATIEWWVI